MPLPDELTKPIDVLLIDNFDSFTWNLYQSLSILGADVTVIRNDAISVDDFVITYFNSGSEITFPVFVWGQAARGVPPQVNVIGSAIFLIAVGIMLVSVIVQTRRRKESAA